MNLAQKVVSVTALAAFMGTLYCTQWEVSQVILRQERRHIETAPIWESPTNYNGTGTRLLWAPLLVEWFAIAVTTIVAFRLLAPNKPEDSQFEP
jgi:hypothetical protein